MTALPTLTRLAEALGVPLDDAALDRFARYRDLLLDWNQRVNLTRVTDPTEVELRLFADSLLLVPYLRRFREANPATPLRLVDVGSGGGFPGIPLKIALPDLDVTLVDATAKKVAFLDAAIAALGLADARAVHGRAEELGHLPDYRGRFDVVTARAVARLPTLLEYCLPLLRPGGLGLFPKGRDATAEAAEARTALATLHARLVAVDPAPLEELAGTAIVVVEQTMPVPASYPRRAGLPAKRPL
ncbi:MAG: 16S rRNA (guanine(527)-N(7))-methyltransferase RsmG [Sphaerobacter sp.]|nr:16S rRNA (guanine(527)-N(7))-methyltransferase RsmG [Sphaerobacter sp.]